jgi:PilZ domain
MASISTLNGRNGASPMKSWLKSLVSGDLRRKSRQAAPPLVAYFWDGGHPVAHSVKNISHTGFYLETTERWLLGTLVMMTLQRTGTDSALAGCSVIVMSKVVRYGEDGVGFTFIPVDNSAASQQLGPVSQAADRKTLDKFLELVESTYGFARFEYIILLSLLLIPLIHGLKDAALALSTLALGYSLKESAPRLSAIRLLKSK